MALALPLVLFAALIGLFGTAAISYHRLQTRRFSLLSELRGTGVLLGLARQGFGGVGIDHVRAQILDVARHADHQSWVEIFVEGVEDLARVPVPPPRIRPGSTGWIFLHEVLSVETADGTIYRF